jgi:hypothetical protein
MLSYLLSGDFISSEITSSRAKSGLSRGVSIVIECGQTVITAAVFGGLDVDWSFLNKYSLSDEALASLLTSKRLEAVWLLIGVDALREEILDD